MQKKLIKSLALIAVMLCSTSLSASEEEHFRASVENAIKPIVSEDIDAAVSATEALVRDGAALVAAEIDHLSGKDKKLSQLIAANATSMLNMSPEELENAWVHGEALEPEGIHIDEYDHFSKAMAFYDMVVHPAMAHSLLKKYRQDQDRHLLIQAREELSELLEHEEATGGGDGHGDSH